jgi:transcriptional regulator with XRE-family HTH domain
VIYSNHPLRQYREKRGLNQEELADLLGVSRQMVGLIESGARRVTPENAKAWAGITGISKAALCPEIFGETRAA